MAATQHTFRQTIARTSSTRQRVMGIIFLALALISWLVFIQQVPSGDTASYGLNATGNTTPLPDWVVPARPALIVIALVCAVAGGIQLARGFGRYTNLALGGVVFLFIFGFLTWATSGSSINLAGLLYNTLSAAVPMTLAAFSGVLSERAGVVNIAIEGMMLLGAMMSALVASVSHSLWLGLLAGILSSMLLAYLHGLLSIKYKADQIISGTVINIFATGLTSYISIKFLQVYDFLNSPGTFPPFTIPGLVKIPVIGAILFDNNIFIYIMFVLLVVLQVALFNTRWGLRMRSVGEHPKAADTLGINVIKTRYMAVLLSGAMAGFAGSYFTLGAVGRFDSLMTGGRGFIGLAAMIFGNWTPTGSFGAGLLFGFADSLASKLAILGIDIPSQFLLMVPYIATMVVLAGLVGRNQAPAADGTPYEKE
jgi:general nucleoside transport system permease protein